MKIRSLVNCKQLHDNGKLRGFSVRIVGVESFLHASYMAVQLQWHFQTVALFWPNAPTIKTICSEQMADGSFEITYHFDRTDFNYQVFQSIVEEVSRGCLAYVVKDTFFPQV